MNQKLLAGLATVGLLAGGGGATALATVGAPAAAASTAAVASSTPGAPPSTPGAPSSHGPLGSLVAQGTITQAQAIAIRNAFITYTQDHWRNTVDTVLGQLVKNHTITQAQASSVTTAITQWVQNHRGGGPGHMAPGHHG